MVNLFGVRLFEERERLGFLQKVFAEKVGVTPRSQINYEKGERLPDSRYLAEAVRCGVDVMYVLTGVRSAPIESTLDRRGQALVDNYINSPEEGKRVIESTALFATKQVGRKTGT